MTGFVDEMAARDLPLSVFHFDCFWMREFHWCDFTWDDRTFPDPAGMLARLKDEGAADLPLDQPLHRPALAALRRRRRARLPAPQAQTATSGRPTSGRPGMGIVDFTNPDARAWYADKLRALLDMGVDCFKTDFGERIPTDVVWSDGSDPERMHNYYTYLYNETVFDLLRSHRGERRGGACSPVRPPPAVSSSRCTGAATASRPSSRWRRACAAACPSPCPASASGATTSAASRDARTRRCSSAGSPSACCPPTAGCTAATATGCRGCSTRSRSRCCAASPG